MDPEPKPVAPARKHVAGNKANVYAAGIVTALKTTLRAEADTFCLLSDSEILSDVKEWIPSGFPEIDHVFGGGWPVGRASEVFGPEGVGKSALAHSAAKSCQDNGGLVVYIDFETALDSDKMEQLGIDPERLIYITPEYAENGWDAVFAILDKIEERPPEKPTLIIWDSVAQAVPKAEYEEKSMDSSHVGALARVMGKGCRRLLRRIAKCRAHVMLINQERDKIGGTGPAYMQEKNTTGGKQIGYVCSLRVRLSRLETMKVGTKAIGYKTKIVTKKNRMAPPHQASMYVLDFAHGPSPALTAFYRFIEWKAIKVAGRCDASPIFKLDGLDEPFTRDDFIQVYDNHRDIIDRVYLEHLATVEKAGGQSDGEDT